MSASVAFRSAAGAIMVDRIPLTLLVGYRENAMPDCLLNGTLLVPDLVHLPRLYPWCARADGTCRSTSPVPLEVVLLYCRCTAAVRLLYCCCTADVLLLFCSCRSCCSCSCKQLLQAAAATAALRSCCTIGESFASTRRMCRSAKASTELPLVSSRLTVWAVQAETRVQASRLNVQWPCAIKGQDQPPHLAWRRPGKKAWKTSIFGPASH